MHCRYAVDMDNQALPCSDPVQLTPSNYYHDISLSVVSIGASIVAPRIIMLLIGKSIVCE